MLQPDHVKQKKTTQRIFFALWPNEQVRKAIASLARQTAQHHQGKLMQPNNLHLTLAFLGNVTDSQRQCVEVMAETISINPFELCLDHIGVFPRAKVLWLGVKEKPDALMQLATSLTQGAQDCGIKLDEKGYNPHVTLMRKVSQLHNMAIEPIHWDVNQFCLMQSVSHPEGVEYKVVKHWS